MGGEVLERVENFKYLGIYLDQHLSFAEHINWVYKKGSMKMGAISKIRKVLDQSTALSLYKSLVLPQLDYCDIVYMSATKENLNRLQMLQNSACRTILLATNDAHIDDMHNTLGLLTLQHRRDLHMSFACHKSVYFNGFSSLSSFYVPVLQVHGRHTRYADSNKMVVPRAKTNLGQKAFSIRGPNHWNSIPHGL